MLWTPFSAFNGKFWREAALLFENIQFVWLSENSSLLIVPKYVIV